MFPARFAISVFLLAAALLPVQQISAQQTIPPVPTAMNHRTRLYLKDGSFQTVMSYKLSGDLVDYVSADRAGAKEEIPADLVDWAATLKWDKEHGPDANLNAEIEAQQQPERPVVLSPELAAEEAERASRRPEIAPDLKLPETGSVFALDYFRNTPELVPLPQYNTDLNPLNSHAVTRVILNPMAAPHMVVTMKGEVSPYQMHVDTPVFYLRVGDDPGPPGGKPFTVDTHGATDQKPGWYGGAANSRYVVLLTDPRVGARVLNSFTITALGAKRQADVIETTTKLLPGGHWISITLREPLAFGEYALMEVIDDRSVNASVWDFGVHSNMGENRDAIKPEPKRPPSLTRHNPDDDTP